MSSVLLCIDLTPVKSVIDGYVCTLDRRSHQASVLRLSRAGEPRRKPVPCNLLDAFCGVCGVFTAARAFSSGIRPSGLVRVETNDTKRKAGRTLPRRKRVVRRPD